MKWAKRHLEVEDENPSPEERNEIYTEFDEFTFSVDNTTGKKIATGIKHGKSDTVFYEWVTHPDLPQLKKRARRKYEIFCGGFLCFYDRDFLEYLKELSNKSVQTGVTGAVVNTLKEYFNKQKRLSQNPLDAGKLRLEHRIFFEWGKEADKDMFVTIYINPDPGNPDPPRPPGPPPPESSE